VKKPSDRTFDWDAARRRLQQGPGASEPDDGQVRQILEERARLLATAPPAARPGDVLDVLIFSLASSQYAIEHAFILEVVRLQSMTPVPGAPPCVAGITNHHGHVLLLVDVRGILGVPSTPLNDLSRIIVLGEKSPEFGLLAERTSDTRGITQAALQPLPAGSIGDHRLYRGVTPEGLTVLDGAALLRDHRFAVEWDGDSIEPSNFH
jgi:purine-binding chemotaxis protein CheW